MQHKKLGWAAAVLFVTLASKGVRAQNVAPLPGTEALTLTGNISVQMLEGFDRYLNEALRESVQVRQQFWKRDFSSPDAYAGSVEPNRQEFRRIIGMADIRLPVTELEYVATTKSPELVAEAAGYRVFAVRWQVLDGVHGEGLLLQPKGKPAARIVALPDADQTPEMITGLAAGIPPEQQFARRLAERGCLVLVPTLIDRRDTWSGNPDIVMTNEPHREWIYRQAYALGRHIIGYEVQKALGAVDWFEATQGVGREKIGIAGYGEGGLIAFYAAAADPRIDATLVSGYFNSRQDLWEEPLYRNVFGLLAEFGDAEIASLIAPRKLVVEYSDEPHVTGPPPASTQARKAAAPGTIQTPELSSVAAEVNRARQLIRRASGFAEGPELITGHNGATVGPGSERALNALLRDLQANAPVATGSRAALIDRRQSFNPNERQHRQLIELERYTQRLALASEDARTQFWKHAQSTSLADWQASSAPYRDYYWKEIIGRLPDPSIPAHPRTRKIYDMPKWTGYEVVLDVWPDVIAWGYLLVPKNIPPGERRPLVVCQHGIEGVPADVVAAKAGTVADKLYHNFAARLADDGYVVYAPHNFYTGNDAFRQLQRKANPLKLTLWSFTVGQHQRLLNWLATLPFVDASRMGFYGLSYGGATAMYVPPVVDRYALVICSGNFTELIRKTVTVDNPYSLVFYHTYEAAEFNIANTFGYAELAGLIAPRPFMVERGHLDTVSSDQWVGQEYAKVRRLYAFLGIPERTAIEFFNGPHSIHGVGTFEFLAHFLGRPAP